MVVMHPKSTPMPNSTAQRLASLMPLPKAALCGLWKQLFEAPPPGLLRRNLIIPILAYRIQEEAFGSISTTSRRRLRQLARVFDGDTNSVIPSNPGIKPGTRLVRQWRNQVHLVNVEAGGYEHQGVRYKSLSEWRVEPQGPDGQGPSSWPEGQTDDQLQGRRMSAALKPVVRCAIYTRKSSEEGLDQSFNSLDAQREACEAYILSQRQEGWRVLSKSL